MHGIAFNEAGELVQASNVKSGRPYYCTTCRCRMYKTHKDDTHYFALVPGINHTSVVCDQIEKSRTVHNAALTMRDRFHAWLMTATEPGNGGGGGRVPGAPGVPGGDGGPLIRELPYRTIKDLYLNSLHMMDDFDMGDCMLTDLIISKITSGCIMMDNNALGPRVVQTLIDNYFDDRKAISFVLCCNETHQRKVFEIFFEKNEQYQFWVKKLFTNVCGENGATRAEVNYKFVFIHGDWKDKPVDACRMICRKGCAGTWTCTGYQCSYYIGERQIFCPPDKAIKHA